MDVPGAFGRHVRFCRLIAHLAAGWLPLHCLRYRRHIPCVTHCDPMPSRTLTFCIPVLGAGAALRPHEERHLQRPAVDDHGGDQQRGWLDRRHARHEGLQRDARPEDHADGAYLQPWGWSKALMSSLRMSAALLLMSHDHRCASPPALLVRCCFLVPSTGRLWVCWHCA